MRITESRLRQVIREVLSEMSDLPQDPLDSVSPGKGQIKVQLVTFQNSHEGGKIEIGPFDDIESMIKDLHHKGELMHVIIHSGEDDVKLKSICDNVGINCQFA